MKIQITYVLLVGVLFLLQTTHAQEAIKKNVYLASISLNEGKKLKGVLYKVNETSVELIRTDKRITENAKLQIVEVLNMKSLSIRKKGSTGLGFAIGASLGAAIGTLIILQSYPGTYDVTPAIMAGAITLGGGLLGAELFGKKTHKINGAQSSFDLIRSELRQYQLYHD